MNLPPLSPYDDIAIYNSSAAAIWVKSNTRFINNDSRRKVTNQYKKDKITLRIFENERSGLYL